ncbi:MAG: thiamine pyrophosphate-binding protein [Candidatus Gastranaerophilales bacterium]|nr:thiamine pyrophosphate-binding protein [Candidatus Gastranaerophilales bacterium]
MINYTDKINTNLKQEMITGGEYIVRILEQQGTDTIFGYPGAPILSVYEALSKTGKIKHYLTRHEQGAIHAAEGYAKVKNKCGVVLVTSGPGFTNTVTGLLNAYTDKTPIVVIAAQSQTCGENEFQDVDITNLTRNCCKKCFSIKDVNDIEKTVKTAFAKAITCPQGPCVIGVTKSVLETFTEYKTSFRNKCEIKVEAPHSSVLKAIDTLKTAERPVIIAGGGCAGFEKELREFALLTNIPVVNTLMATGCAGGLSYGMIGDSGDDYLNQIIKKSDVVLAPGTRFSDRTTCHCDKFLPDTKIISINIEHNTSKNVSIEEEIIGEINIVLQQMIGVIKSKNILFDIHYDWLERVEGANKRVIENGQMKPECTAAGTGFYTGSNDTASAQACLSGIMTPEYVLNEIYNYTKKYHPIITTDVGEHQICAAKTFKPDSSKNFLTSGGFGTMGYGLPAAIGACIAKPNSLVMNITGDGSFQMNLQELGTCAEYNIGLKIIIMNNSSLGMVKTLQQKNYNNTFCSNMINPDFVKLAQSYGILGIRVRNEQELHRALKEMFRYRKAVLLDIQVQ